MPRVALLTDLATGPLDEDHEALRAALDAVGVIGELLAWDGPASDPASVADRFDLVVIRSPWDYPLHADRYVEALDALAQRVPVLNPPAMVRWNVDKRYLDDLAAAGVPVAPTRFAAPGDDPASVCRWAASAGELVVKPSVSAGSRDTARYRPAEVAAAVEHVRALHAAGRTAMVQPYLEAVERDGETAVVFLDGAYSHGLRKGPLLQLDAGFVQGLFAVEEMSPRTPSDAQRAVAEQVVAVVGARFGTPLYARVDLIDGEDGAPVVLEAELNEPSLFHAHAPGSADRFAAAIVARLR